MASKSKRRRRVLGASCILAALIVGASSFAWFTSKDEVTNRLTATADYGVSAVEDFTPPEDMTPGQTVTKKVSAVNTGSVDALVRMGVENMLNITTYDGTAVTLGTAETTYYYTDGTSDTDHSGASTKTDAYSLKDFKVTVGTFPTTAVELSDHEHTDADGNKVANEVSQIQAGGQLVVEAGKAVSVTDQVKKSGDDSNSDYSGTDQYKPTTAGLYIFRRTVYETNSTNTNSVVKYSGYWFDGSKYYALVTDYDTSGTNPQATVYLPDGAVTETATGTGSVVTALDASKIKIKKTVTTDAAGTASKLTMSFVKSDKSALGSSDTVQDVAKYIKAVYDPDNTASSGDEVIFFIKLDDNWKTNWTYIAKDSINPTDGTSAIGKALGYFYLKNDLDAGTTSPKLIDSVEMDSSVTQQAFVDLTYDINVLLESVQITKDADGNEIVPAGAQIGGKNSSTADSAATAISAFDNVKAQVATRTSGEITAITWTPAS